MAKNLKDAKKDAMKASAKALKVKQERMANFDVEILNEVRRIRGWLLKQDVEVVKRWLEFHFAQRMMSGKDDRSARRIVVRDWEEMAELCTKPQSVSAIWKYVYENIYPNAPAGKDFQDEYDFFKEVNSNSLTRMEALNGETFLRDALISFKAEEGKQRKAKEGKEKNRRKKNAKPAKSEELIAAKKERGEPTDAILDLAKRDKCKTGSSVTSKKIQKWVRELEIKNFITNENAIRSILSRKGYTKEKPAT